LQNTSVAEADWVDISANDRQQPELRLRKRRPKGLLWFGSSVILLLGVTCLMSTIAPLPVLREDTPTMAVGTPTRDAEGVEYYPVSSIYEGNQPQTIRVLEPTHPAPGQPHRILFVLPVYIGYSTRISLWGDGLETLRLLDVQDRYNLTLIAPSFDYEPWYGDNSSDQTRRAESFIVDDLVRFSNTFAQGQTPQRYIVGFSKSGNAALFLILRHPGIFNGAADWDSPAQLSNINQKGLSSPGALQMNFGTQANFDRYNIPSLLKADGAPFQHQKRLWIGEDHGVFTNQMDELNKEMMAASVAHIWVEGATRAHRWDSGWLQGAVADMMANATNSAPDGGNLPPPRSGGLPFGVLRPGSTQATLMLDTDGPADCRYATTAGIAYSDMDSGFFTKVGISHTAVVGGLHDGGDYDYYVRCKDRNTGVVNADDYQIGFSVAVPGGRCGNLVSSAMTVLANPSVAPMMWNFAGSLTASAMGDGVTLRRPARCAW
jgi:hypothetical protein